MIQITCLCNILVQDISHDSVHIANIYEVLPSKEKLLLIMFLQAQLKKKKWHFSQRCLRLEHRRSPYCVIFYVGILDEF